jgi:hypothetical protein
VDDLIAALRPILAGLSLGERKEVTA